MKRVKGDYAGASEFAQFDLGVVQMTDEERRRLLESILHQASAGGCDSNVIFNALRAAEEHAQLNVI